MFKFFVEIGTIPLPILLLSPQKTVRRTILLASRDWVNVNRAIVTEELLDESFVEFNQEELK